MANYIHVKVQLPDESEREAQAAKTARLRAFRLIKEAADREAAKRESASAPTREADRRRVVPGASESRR